MENEISLEGRAAFHMTLPQPNRVSLEVALYYRERSEQVSEKVIQAAHEYYDNMVENLAEDEEEPEYFLKQGLVIDADGTIEKPGMILVNGMYTVNIARLAFTGCLWLPQAAEAAGMKVYEGSRRQETDYSLSRSRPKNSEFHSPFVIVRDKDGHRTRYKVELQPPNEYL